MVVGRSDRADGAQAECCSEHRWGAGEEKVSSMDADEVRMIGWRIRRIREDQEKSLLGVP